MIKITNQKQLESFLKEVSSNSLKSALNSVFENADPYIKNFKDNLQGELDRLEEQEEGEEDPEAEDPEATGEEDAEVEGEEESPEETEQPPKEKTNFAAEKALELIDYENDFDISFENVVTALNTMRAGKSTKNKEIKTELGDYYERLTEDERALMLLYLNELSKVLTGATEGEDAQDPSEPSTYFKVIRTNKKQNKDTEVTDSSSEDLQRNDNTASKTQASSQQSSGEEDTTPPIKVNESQDMKAIYRKVKLLMRG